MSLKNIEQNPNGEEKKPAKSAKNKEKPSERFLQAKLFLQSHKTSHMQNETEQKKTLRKKVQFSRKYKLTRGYKKKDWASILE